MLELILAAGLESLLVQEPRPLEFRTDVGLIRLDVSVVDARGRSVPGLGRGDFRVLEDGRPVELTYFEAFDLGSPATPGSTFGPRPIAPAATPRRALILVDSARMTRFQLARARTSLARFLHGATDGDAVHLVNLSTDATWSGVIPDDRGRLIAAARGLARHRSPWERVSDGDRVEDVVELERAGDGEPSQAHTSGRFLSDFAESRDLLAMLEGYLVALGGVGGRKALVLVSPGFPALRDLERRLERVASLARESATAIYYVDSVGLDELVPVPGQRLAPAFETAWARSGGAQDLAAYTGGFTSRFANSLAGALGRVGQELRTYYVLGYVPARPADGRFREVSVRVSAPGLRARTKKGYLAGRRPD